MKTNGTMWVTTLALVLGACGAPGEAPESPTQPIRPVVGTLPTGPGVVAPTEVTVRLYEGTPLASADVLFLEASGALSGRTETNASGEARGPLGDGGTVTIASQNASGNRLDIIAGAEPGQTFGIGWIDGATVASVRVVPPGPFEGAWAYQFENGCYTASGLTLPADVSLSIVAPECPAGEVSVLALVLGFDGLPIAYSYATDVPVPAGSEVEVAMPAWKTDFIPMRVGTAGTAPAGMPYLELRAWLARGGARFAGVATWSATEVELLVPPGFADHMGYEITTYGSTTASRLLRQTPMAQAATVTVDLSAEMLSAPHGTIAADGRVALPEDAPSLAAVAVELSWPAVSSVPSLVASLVSPAAPGSVVSLPTLPADLAQHTPGTRAWDGASLTWIAAEGAYSEVAQDWLDQTAGPDAPGARTVRSSTVYVAP